MKEVDQIPAQDPILDQDLEIETTKENLEGQDHRLDILTNIF